MTDMYNAQRGYGQVKRQASSEKHIEIELFTKMTTQLKSHVLAEESALKLTPSLARDLLSNLKLWQIIMLDLLTDENTLELSLKKSLIELAEFTQSHTQKIFRNEGAVDVLIDINVAILSGLRTGLSAGRTAKTHQSNSQDIREIA